MQDIGSCGRCTVAADVAVPVGDPTQFRTPVAEPRSGEPGVPRRSDIPTGHPKYIDPDRREPVPVNGQGGVEESDVIESNETTDH